MRLSTIVCLVVLAAMSRSEAAGHMDTAPHTLETSAPTSGPTGMLTPSPSAATAKDSPRIPPLTHRKKKAHNGTDLCNATVSVPCSTLTRSKYYTFNISDTQPCTFSCYYDPSQVWKWNESLKMTYCAHTDGWVLLMQIEAKEYLCAVFQMSPLRLEVHEHNQHPMHTPVYVSVQQDYYISSWTLPIIFPVMGEK